VARALSGVPGISQLTELVISCQNENEQKALDSANKGGKKQYKSLI
jgi:hypothetical protein